MNIPEAMTMAATTKTLFRRGLRKQISTAAGHMCRMINLSASDRDRALSKFSHEVSEELRALNCTLAAIAIKDRHDGARLYLRQVVESGIESHGDRTRQNALIADLEELAQVLNEER